MIVSQSGPEAGTMGIQTVGGGCKPAVFGLVFVLLFLFNWLRKANTLRSFVSVWGVCA